MIDAHGVRVARVWRALQLFSPHPSFCRTHTHTDANPSYRSRSWSKTPPGSYATTHIYQLALSYKSIQHGQNMGPKKKLQIRHEKCIKKISSSFHILCSYKVNSALSIEGNLRLHFFAALSILTTGTTCWPTTSWLTSDQFVVLPWKSGCGFCPKNILIPFTGCLDWSHIELSVSTWKFIILPVHNILLMLAPIAAVAHWILLM